MAKMEFQFQVPSPRSFIVSPSSNSSNTKKRKKWSTKKRNYLILALSACGFLCISNLIWSAHTTTTKILQRALLSSNNHEYNDHPTVLHPNPILTTSTSTAAHNKKEEDQHHHHQNNNSSNNSDTVNNNKTTVNNDDNNHDNNNNNSENSSSSSSSHDTDIDDYPFTFGACLMTKDDNQILPEWLAYHYTVLPLRYLIIAVDPFSLTTPLPILDKYRQLGMNIEFWDRQKRYWYDGRKKTMKRKFFNHKNYTWSHRWQMRRQRQDCFYTACLRKFRTNPNISWVTLIDTDEYFTYNPKFTIEDSNKDIGKIRSNVPSKIGNQNETIAHYIANKHNSFDSKNNQSLCRVYPRLDFLASDEVNTTTFINESILPSSDDDDDDEEATTITTTLSSIINNNNANNSFCHHFHSLCYQSHGTLGNRKFPGKALVNVQNYNGKYKVTNPHRPFGDRCDNSQFGSIQNKDAPFRIHHYTGSLETFLSRPERQKSGWIKRNFDKPIKGYDVSLNKWFIEFTKLVGPGGSLDKALELTYGLRSMAYNESMDIKRRIEQYNETIKPIFDWW